MKLGVIALSKNPVSIDEPGYGPHNAMVAMLVDGLVERGHDVHLWALEGSRTRAVLHASQADHDDERGLAFQHRSTLEAVEAGCAVIHSQTPKDPFFWNLIGLPVPKVHTFHHVGDPHYRNSWGALQRMFDPLGSITNVCLGEAHARVSPAGLEYERIPWGLLPAQTTRPATARGSYLATFSRVVPSKGIHHAITVAEKTGIPLKIAGPLEDTRLGRAYFERVIQRRLTSGRVEYVGVIGDAGAKNAFLGHATALLNPIEWDEPFGLSVIESMAAGTPVISFRRGGPAESIEDGITGLLVDDVNAMVEAVGRVEALSRSAVQGAALSRFTAGAVVDAYEAVYRRSVARFQRLPREVEDENLRVLAALDPRALRARNTQALVEALRARGGLYAEPLRALWLPTMQTGLERIALSARQLPSTLGWVTQCRPRSKLPGLLALALGLR